MGQRNMIIDVEMDQQAQGYLHPEPCIFLGSAPTFPQPHISTVITAPGNISNIEVHHLPEPYENPMFYGMPQYHGVQHHRPNLDTGVATAPNSFVPYVSSHGVPSQLPYSIDHGVAFGEHVGNSHLMDNAIGTYKRKNAEGTPGNSQYLNSQAAPIFSFTPTNSTDSASFVLPPFRGMGNTLLREVGSMRSAGSRSGIDPVLAHGQNNFIQGNYIDHQPFPPRGSLWFDQQLSNGRTDRGASSWSQSPSMPHMHGSNVASSSFQSGNISLQRYHHEPSCIRNSAAFLYPPLMNPRQHYFSHHPSPPPIQGTTGHRTGLYPHVVAPASYRVPGSYSTQSTVHDGLDMGSTHVGPVQATDSRMYRHHQERLLPEPTLRHRSLPHLRVMPADEIALLEVGDFYATGNSIDHHRDMRLDIEDMSYEELLALSEQIGTVNTGLSEENVANHLKTRIYTGTDLGEALTVDQENDSCTICQENYKNQEKIGTLDCGHEYHSDCLKKWLFVKNVCPICKFEALALAKKGVESG